MVRLENLLQELHLSSSNSGKEHLKAACSDLEKIRKLKKEAEFLEASFRAKAASLEQVNFSSFCNLSYSSRFYPGIFIRVGRTTFYLASHKNFVKPHSTVSLKYEDFSGSGCKKEAIAISSFTLLGCHHNLFDCISENSHFTSPLQCLSTTKLIHHYPRKEYLIICHLIF